MLNPRNNRSRSINIVLEGCTNKYPFDKEWELRVLSSFCLLDMIVVPSFTTRHIYIFKA